MVKAPEAGRVKTRLSHGIGVTEALRFYRSATSALARRLAHDARWQTSLSIAPERCLRHPVWPAGIARHKQGRGGLGERMQKVFDELPPGPVIIVGSDIPGITPAHIARAFRKLGHADIVLGPANDGGYWLVGYKRHPRIPDVFKNVRWSHPETLNDTLRNATGLHTELVDALDDIDEATDLKSISGWSGRVVLPAAIYRQIDNSAS
ncbi:MAG: TIGR04282 family arsenosugar biosynthesis glycosyltransferase [Alphaproteobacteria bacterium]|nr:TIGR04282 family arsenosugar biosynthesis glycosyltransferase [Alphaproteobacteria bacterium]